MSRDIGVIQYLPWDDAKRLMVQSTHLGVVVNIQPSLRAYEILGRRVLSWMMTSLWLETLPIGPFKAEVGIWSRLST
ncbi:uncharacterized protein N7500_001419 [Penicillium coprophilum]|uniref:uncharacterized protein n=1 Tax=Penicillium coprophilum TaxID=36646 RepID=UPI002381F15B|nr:uncharacterized protein N7500_001419 [Penicillium coprophilum]KAJ5173488.1 hypothetical protein N7500_001419 [Penicillium coprophilum]